MATLMPRLVNSLVKGVDFRFIAGDNFYDDQDGNITQRFYRQLTPEAQAVIEITVPGNHDFWVAGSPLLRTQHDPFGDGFMQWFASDGFASVALNSSSAPGGAFLNLSVDPSDRRSSSEDDQEEEEEDGSSGGGKFGSAGDTMKRPNGLPDWSNYFVYHKVGNIGFIGFSGAHDWEEQQEAFSEACAYFDQDDFDDDDDNDDDDEEEEEKEEKEEVHDTNAPLTNYAADTTATTLTTSSSSSSSSSSSKINNGSNNKPPPAVIFLVGHWNEPALGCAQGKNSD
jgi:hypothetical protein